MSPERDAGRGRQVGSAGRMPPEGAVLNAHLDGGPFFWEAGPTGVFLSHGLTATSSEVRLLAQRLYDAGYTVAGPLLPGHGTTPADLNRTTWRDWVRAGDEVYGRLAARCERVFVGGESMGAVVALYLASEHPGVAGVLAYAPAIKLAIGRLNMIRLHALAPFKPWVRKAGPNRSEYWQGYVVNPLKATLQLVHFGREVTRRLPRIDRPVLVVQGRLDGTIAPDAGAVIMRGVSAAIKEHYWMEQSGHTVLLDRERDEIMTLTLRFLERAVRVE